MPQVCLLGCYIGISQRAEIIFMVVLSIICNFFDKSPLEISTNIKKIWNLKLNEDIFSEYTQQNLKSLLTGIVAVRSLTVQAYIISSFVLLYPLLSEDRAWLCYPWLLISAMKNLGTSFLSFTVGLFVCATYGVCKPACVVFGLEQIIDILPSLYMWLKVVSFCRELRKPKVLDLKLPEEIEELETLTAIRRRMARSMTTETVLRQQIERRRRIGNSALGMVDIFKPNITQNLVCGSKSLDTLLENIANDEYYDMEDDYISLEEGLKPSQITMKLLGITESQIEAARRSKSNGQKSKSDDNIPRLKTRYQKCTHISDYSGPSCSKNIKTKLYCQSSLYNIPQRIIRRTKSDIDMKKMKNEPVFLNDVEEREIKSFGNESDDEVGQKKKPNRNKNSTDEKLFEQNETVDNLYDLKNITGYKLQKLKSFLNTPLRKCTFLNKIKHELIEQMFTDNKTEMKKFEKIFERKNKMRSSTDLGLQQNYGLMRRDSSFDSMKNYSQTSFQTQIKNFSIKIKRNRSGNIYETASDIVYNKSLFIEVNENENVIRRPYTEQIDAVQKNVLEAQKLLVRIGDRNVRELCDKLLEAVKCLKYEKHYKNETNFLHSVSRYNLLKDLLKILNKENNLTILEKRRVYNFQNGSVVNTNRKNQYSDQKENERPEVLELHSNRKTPSNLPVKKEPSFDEATLEPKRKLIENFYLDSARLALFAELKSKFQNTNSQQTTQPDSNRSQPNVYKQNSYGFKLKLPPDTIQKYMDKANPPESTMEIELEKRTSNFYGFLEKRSQLTKKIASKNNKNAYEKRYRSFSDKKGSNLFTSRVPLRADIKSKSRTEETVSRNSERKLSTDEIGSKPFFLKLPHCSKSPKKIIKSVSHEAKKQSFASNQQTRKNVKPKKIIPSDEPNPFRLKFLRTDSEITEEFTIYDPNRLDLPPEANDPNEIKSPEIDKPATENINNTETKNLPKDDGSNIKSFHTYIDSPPETKSEDASVSEEIELTTTASFESKTDLLPSENQSFDKETEPTSNFNPSSVTPKNFSNVHEPRIETKGRKRETGKQNLQSQQNKINTTTDGKKTKHVTEIRRKPVKAPNQKVQASNKKPKLCNKHPKTENKQSVKKISSQHKVTKKNSQHSYTKQNRSTYSELYAKRTTNI